MATAPVRDMGFFFRKMNGITKLGRIANKTQEELALLLSEIDVQFNELLVEAAQELNEIQFAHIESRLPSFKKKARDKVIKVWNEKFDHKLCEYFNCNSTETHKYVGAPGYRMIRYYCVEHCREEYGVSCGLPGCNKFTQAGGWSTRIFYQKVIHCCLDCRNSRRNEFDFTWTTVKYKRNEDARADANIDVSALLAESDDEEPDPAETMNSAANDVVIVDDDEEEASSEPGSAIRELVREALAAAVDPEDDPEVEIISIVRIEPPQDEAKENDDAPSNTAADEAADEKSD